MTTNYPNGAGESLGDTWTTCAPLLMSGVIWWVDSVTGTNAASPAGQDREKPLATLAQAVTNASNGDMIVLKSTHAEQLTTTVTIAKELTIAGAGSTGGLPSARITFDASGEIILNTAARQEIRNVYFGTRTALGAVERVSMSGSSDVVIDGCYFECGPNDNAPAVNVSAGCDRLQVNNTTFVSIATSLSSRPESGLKIASGLAGTRLNGVTFDGGTVGFSNPYACDSSTAALTTFEWKSISLLRGAEIKFNASATGRLNVQTATGGGRVTW